MTDNDREHLQRQVTQLEAHVAGLLEVVQLQQSRLDRLEAGLERAEFEIEARDQTVDVIRVRNEAREARSWADLAVSLVAPGASR